MEFKSDWENRRLVYSIKDDKTHIVKMDPNGTAHLIEKYPLYEIYINDIFEFKYNWLINSEYISHLREKRLSKLLDY